MALVPGLGGERGDVGARPLPERGELDPEPPAARDQLEERAVDPVDHGPVVLARAVEAGPVLLAAGQEQVMALDTAERVQQAPRAREAAERPVADLHPD